ncbi:MAG: amino acid adenylation domain-containing protein [Marinifilaceae bacterium]
MQYNSEIDYWLEKLSNVGEKCNFPYDYLNGGDNFNGQSYHVSLPPELAGNLLKISGDSDFRLFVLMKAGLSLLLNKYTSKGRIVIGCPIVKQENDDNLINNYLPVSIDVDEQQGFISFLNSVKNELASAIDNQNCSFEALHNYLGLEHHPQRQSFFDIAILLEGFHEEKWICDLNLDLIFKFSKNSNSLNLKVDYNSVLYKKDTIANITSHLFILMQEALENKNSSVSELVWYSPQESDKVLNLFNQNANNFNLKQTIPDLFKNISRENPDRIIASYGDEFLSYQMADLLSSRFAAYLQAKGAKKGDKVIVKKDLSCEFIINLLGVLKTGGVYVPVDNDIPNERLMSIVDDCEARFIIAHELDSVLEESLKMKGVRVFQEEKYISESALKSVGVEPEDTIYIVYTSGSTGKPKGVKVSHRGIVNMCYSYKDIFGTRPDSIVSVVSNPAFDALAFELWPNIVNGSKVCIATPDLIHDINQLVDWVNACNITILYLPTAVAEMALELELPIQSVEIMLTAGDVLKAYPSQSTPYKLFNLYGPTEDSVWTTVYRVPNEGVNNQFPLIGSPIYNKKIFIVNDKLQLLPCGVPGEICIGGAGIAKGYVGDFNEGKFIESPFNGSETLYKTGDLGRWLSDGNIEFLGRKDNQTKVRGYRIELDEIRSVLLRYSSVKEAIVVVRDIDSEKYLCAYFTTVDAVDVENLKSYLKKFLPHYMLPDYFICIDEFELKRNGKINEAALPLPSNNSINIVEPKNACEQKLFEIWSELLGADNFGIDHNFFEIGGHSLRATKLVSFIEDTFNVKIKFRKIFEYPSIREQATLISNIQSKTQIEQESGFDSSKNVEDKEKNNGDQSHRLHEILNNNLFPLEKQEYYPVSAAQKRLFMLQQLNIESTAYNVPNYIQLSRDIDLNSIIDVLNRIVEQHEAFRTDFIVKDGVPYQRIHSKTKVEIEMFNVDEGMEDDLMKEFSRPFDLTRFPLFRIGCFKVKNKMPFLIIDMHHIICDGITQNIVEEQINDLINGKLMHPMRVQYKDYSAWQNSFESDSCLMEEEKYWLKQLDGEIPMLSLPADFIRSNSKSFEGASVSAVLSKKESEVIKSVAAQNGLTLYMSILSVFTILLSKLSGQEDIIVGTPVAGRNHRDLEDIAGVFINTLAMRNEVRGNDTIKEFLGKLKRTTLDAFDNQNYQFENLVEKVVLERDMSRHPIFDVMFNMLNHSEFSGDFSGEENLKYKHKYSLSKFDITLTATDYGQQIMLNFTYCTKLFKGESIERFISYFKRIIQQISCNELQKIGDLEIVSEEERCNFICNLNNTKTEYPREKAIHLLFEEEVSKNPDSIALVYNDMQISYSDVNKKSNRIACYLRSKGVGEGSVVGLFFDPSIEMAIGIIGVLKAGASFLPISPENPIERVSYMLADSGSEFVLTHNAIGSVHYPDVDVIVVEDVIHSGDECEYVSKPSSYDPAYVIYTSGTTGTPKGVVVSHNNVVNYIHWLTNKISLNQFDRAALTSSYTFDAVYTILFGALLNSARLSILPREVYLSSNELVECVDKEGITLLKMTPSLFQLTLDSGFLEKGNFSSVRFLMLGGEAISIADLERYHRINDKSIIMNHYGPTESTIGSIATVIDGRKLSDYISCPYIGMPISNTEIYILDRYDKVQPVQVPGELCIGGDGLSLGYLNNPELTAEKFIPHPFEKGKRLYKTGDLARWLPDGNVEFIGRLDHQVKIRGFRIELGEIECILSKHEFVKECIVLAQNLRGEKYLCAYIVLKETMNVDSFRGYLAKVLPDYMIPSYFTELDRIPINSSGKLNRNLLPSPEVKAGDNYLPPVNEIEETLVRIWAEVLKIEEKEIGVMDNFFGIGGNSLKVMMVLARVVREFNVKISLAQVFTDPYIRTMASYISLNMVADEELEYDEMEL